jgi:murein L,D-transpeptidase YcbB/YkuD
MRRIFLVCLIILVSVFLLNVSCSPDGKHENNKIAEDNLHGVLNQQKNLPFDSSRLTAFFRSFPKLQKYQKDVSEVYRQHQFTQIWFDEEGVIEFGYTLYNRASELKAEGISSVFPYQLMIDEIFDTEKGDKLSGIETEIMLTNLYLFYTEKVYSGLGDSTSTALGWLLPRKQISYSRLLDSVMSDEQVLNHDKKVLYSQYYKLRDILKHYQKIEAQRRWKIYAIDPEQIAIPTYNRALNLSTADRIKKIIVNMERCRWISAEIDQEKEFIMVNIPAFTLSLVKNGKTALESRVIVGNSLNKTVIFKGMMNQIVFSPYWNLPQSIVDDDVIPGIAKNRNYLKNHNMEWNNGLVRQKPGNNNSLGLVKFIFPNSADIYLHDTPSKSLFEKQSRAFSHGCIRVKKPRELAITILKGDLNWTPEKIDAAMHSGREQAYSLQIKIPVYITYLTAWVDEQGRINFYADIYNRDARLAKLLIASK